MYPNVHESNGNTGLHCAAFHGNLEEVVQALLKKGADVEAQNNNGDTALHIAAQEGHLEIVQALLIQPLWIKIQRLRESIEC